MEDRKKEQRADVVFVIDASDSMRPCFDQLKSAIKSFVEPFKQAGFESLRLGLLAYRTGVANGQWVNRFSFVCGDDPKLMKDFYGDDEEEKEKFFTRSGDYYVDTDSFCKALDNIECTADENTPLALDCAADFPFMPPCEARRVIVLFTDEKIEDGVLKDEPISKLYSDETYDGNLDTMTVMDKLEARHISLYCFAPCSEALEVISEYNRVVVTEVKDAHERLEGENSWEEIDFDKVMSGIGKSISRSVQQKSDDDEFKPAIYEQNTWDMVQWGEHTSGGIVDITGMVDGLTLDTSEPIEWVKATMHWDTPIDLDLHAFYLNARGDVVTHIFYGNMKDDTMWLDHDAGVHDKLDKSSGNDEAITVSKFNNVKKILFATKIFGEKGCFSDYRGRVEVVTSNPRQPEVHANMVSKERLDWCVIAMLDNSNPDQPKLYSINKVIANAPDVLDSEWNRD